MTVRERREAAQQVIRHRRAAIDQFVQAYREAAKALVPLDFNEKRRAIRYICDEHGIDPVKLV